jgi:hypothetical protein
LIGFAFDEFGIRNSLWLRKGFGSFECIGAGITARSWTTPLKIFRCSEENKHCRNNYSDLEVEVTV